MNGDWRARLAAFDDRELDRRERALLERLLDSSPEARAYLAALRSDRQRFGEAFGTVEAAPGFVSAVMDKLPQRRATRPLPRLLEVCAAAMMLLVAGSVIRPLARLDQANLNVCQRNAKELTQALLSYTDDYDGRLPDATRWPAQVAAYTERPTYRCPEDRVLDLSPSYGMPMGLSLAELRKAAPTGREMLLFDAEGPFVAPRHERRSAAVAGYANGSVDLVRLGGH